jgi:TonB family protein
VRRNQRQPNRRNRDVTTIAAILDEQRPPLRLWTIAAFVAVALHAAGVALAFAHLNSGDGDSLGANVTEIGVELVSPTAEATDLPAGPDSDASVASPALAEQKAEIKPTELPKETPQETDNPDRIVTQNDTKKPTEDDPKIEKVQTAASQESVAQEATARQPLENAREANLAAAPNIGIGKDKQMLSANWGRQISAYFELHKRYPKVSRVRQATVKVALVLNRLGHVVQLAVAQSSGDPAYDEAALDMIRRSDPVPRPPAALTDDTFSYSLDVNFKGGK